MWLSIKIFKDITSPPAILSVIWSIMYFILIICTYPYDSSNFYYIIFLISNICFLFGFIIPLNNQKIQKIENINKYEDLSIRVIAFKIFLFIEILILIYFIVGIIVFTMNNFENNIWFSLKYGRATGKYYEGQLVERFRVVAITMTHIMAIVYMKTPSKVNKKYYFIQLIITFILIFFGVGRTTLFTLFIPLIFIYIYIKRPNNKKIIITLLKGSIILLVTFIIYAYMKFPYLVGESPFEFIMGQLQLYTVSPMIAFVNWCGINHDYAYGGYTFSGILSFLSAIGLEINVPSRVSEYVLVGNDLTNVYTVLHYYAKDFGVLYSLFIQILIGVFHGFLYKKAVLKKNSSIFSIAIFSLFFYSLIMQFFVDQYMSLLSQWIQYAIWYYIISKSSIFISVNNRI